ncbi:unnamed protein product, partial [Iphiclides podalirius]
MNEKGMLEKETVLERAKKIFDDEEELKLLGDYLHSCSHINEEAVSDGEEGCERASLAYKCLTENALQAGLDLHEGNRGNSLGTSTNEGPPQ